MRALVFKLALVTMIAGTTFVGVAGTSSAAYEPERYGLESVGVALSSPQAGAHADLTTGFRLTTHGENESYAVTRDIAVQLPPGVIGNPQGIPQCTSVQLGAEIEESECPIDSQVGVAEVSIGGVLSNTFNEPVYNLERPKNGDIVARLGFFALFYPSTINIRVDPLTYGLVATLEGSPAAAEVVGSTVTLWGVPAASEHDPFRITPAEAAKSTGPPGGRPSSLPPAPFMTNPTSCEPPGTVTFSATSYQRPALTSTKQIAMPQIIGCGKVKFNPSLSLSLTNPEASAPTGVNAELSVPQDETAQGRGTSTLRSARVILPPGLTINPAAGDGLGACSAEEVGFEENVAAHCPDSSKIGSAEIDVPALEHPLQGSVYQRTPEQGKLFRFWLVADELGVHLKLPAEIEADPVTGQLTTVFAGLNSIGGNPQVPVSDLKLRVFGGPRAPLATPAQCGDYETHYEFIPWSGNPATTGETETQVTTGCGKGGFAPSLTAGTLGSSAGSFSPFVMQLTRSDGEANPQLLDVSLPEGLLAKLNGVALCPEAATGDAACPASSQVGTVAAAAGVGGAPLWIPQPGKAPTAVYLAGPYKGAPYSLVIKVPAQAGPFDLGTVVTRAGIYVDPESTKVTIKSDPLPQILEGVPVAYRAIRVETNRPEFTLNPTDCDTEQVRARVTAVGGRVSEPTAPFQATNCATLAFSPELKLFLSGQTKRTGNPAVKAVLTQPKGPNANLAGTTVILPRGMFIDQSHINDPCTRVQFNSTPVAGEGCPAKSVLGTAKVWTPLLERPEEGNVYFRSNGGERELPDLVLALRGQVPLQLVGFVDSVGKKGAEVRRVRTRFQTIPDAPFSRFELKLAGGKRGLLENSKDLCKAGDKANFSLAGQNGKVEKTEPKVMVSCGGRRAKKVPPGRVGSRNRPTRPPAT